MIKISSQNSTEFNAGDVIHQFSVIKLLAKGGMGIFNNPASQSCVIIHSS